MKPIMQRYYNNDELTADERNQGDIGPIRMNMIKCNKCGDIIQSANRHDFKWCECKSVAVDGGSWYAKRLGEDWEEMMVMYKDRKDEE